MAQAVKVMVRCRPMNKNEMNRGSKCVVTLDIKNRLVSLIKQDTREPPKNFTFDYVFDSQSLQSLIYQQSAFSLVDNVLEGYNGTIFAYGQTGCGKTHTMMGVPDNQQLKGIIPRTFSQIITVTKADAAKTNLIRCSFIEIYNQQIHDLLGKDTKARMQLKQSPQKGIFIKGLNQIQVDSIDKMQQYMDVGFKNRATRATNMNAESSRSHSIFTIYIDTQQIDEKGNDKYKASKLNLVDLAGSERASKTGATGDGMKQATKINLSLSALGNVISALVDGKTHHIPYRDSKLTRLLQDSLGGNTKTIMIAAVSPADYNYDETLSTLRYASRAKFIQNKPKINEDPKDALLRQYMQEIKKLKMMLQGKMPLSLQATSSSGGQNIQIQQRIVYKEGDNKQNAAMMQQLKMKDNLLKAEQEEKKRLAQKLQGLQHVFDKSKPSQSNQNQLEKIKKLKEKLKAQKKKQEQYERQKQKRQSELMNIEKNYKSLNQQVDQMRDRFQQIKKKYIANLSELRDIQNQHEDEKEELLDTIRFQEKQIKKFSSILNILMNESQIDYIINNSQWDQEKRQWRIPNFTYKEKSVNLPKINNRDMDAQRQKKQVVFRDSKRDSERKTQGFKVNHIVRNARQSGEYDFASTHSSGAAQKNNNSNRTQLTPLKNQSIDRLKLANIPFPDDGKKKKIDRLDPLRFDREPPSPDPRTYFAQS